MKDQIYVRISEFYIMPSNVGTACAKKWVEKIPMKWTGVDMLLGVI